MGRLHLPVDIRSRPCPSFARCGSSHCLCRVGGLVCEVSHVPSTYQPGSKDPHAYLGNNSHLGEYKSALLCFPSPLYSNVLFYIIWVFVADD